MDFLLPNWTTGNDLSFSISLYKLTFDMPSTSAAWLTDNITGISSKFLYTLSPPFLRSQACTYRLQAVFSFSPTSYSILDWTRQFLLAALPKSLDFQSSYRNAQVNTQKPWFSAKNSPYCIRIWNHTQKYYESKSRQALPDGVFGHFNARKSYPFILL